MFCPVCRSVLIIRQMNFESAVYLCEHEDCPYPLGYDWVIIPRKYQEMLSSAPQTNIAEGNSETQNDLDAWLQNISVSDVGLEVFDLEQFEKSLNVISENARDRSVDAGQLNNTSCDEVLIDSASKGNNLEQFNAQIDIVNKGNLSVINRSGNLHKTPGRENKNMNQNKQIIVRQHIIINPKEENKTGHLALEINEPIQNSKNTNTQTDTINIPDIGNVEIKVINGETAKSNSDRNETLGYRNKPQIFKEARLMKKCSSLKKTLESKDADHPEEFYFEIDIEDPPEKPKFKRNESILSLLKTLPTHK